MRLFGLPKSQVCMKFSCLAQGWYKQKYCRWIPKLMQGCFHFPHEDKQIKKQPFNLVSLNAKASGRLNKMLFEWCMIRARHLHFAKKLTVVFVGSLGLTDFYVNVPPQKWVHAASCTRTAHTIKTIYFIARSILIQLGRTKFQTSIYLKCSF